MSSSDDFVHVSTGLGGLPSRFYSVSQDYFANSNGDRTYTEGFMVASIRQKHPNHLLTVSQSYSSDLIGFAASRDDVTCVPRGTTNEALVERQFNRPARRYNDEVGGTFSDRVLFGAFDYTFKGIQFLVYVADGHDGMYHAAYNYILIEDSEDNKALAQSKVDELLADSAAWTQELHE